MDYLQKKPKWKKYQEEKEPPKIITMLKLGDSAFNQASFIYQEASNNISDEKIMTVMASGIQKQLISEVFLVHI